MPALKVALHKEAIAEARAAREWYEVRSVAVAEAIKYLLLEHAFEHLKAVRVQLKTDGRNRQSQ